VPESYAAAGVKRAGLEQGVLHAGHLLLHRIERLPDHRRAHFAGAQVAHFFDLQEIKKRVDLCGGYKFSLFPGCQLSRREPKNTE